MNAAREDAVRRGDAVDGRELIVQGAAIDAPDRDGQVAPIAARASFTVTAPPAAKKAG